MTNSNQPLPSFFSRISIAIGAFFRALSDAEYAARLSRIDEAPQPAAAPVAPAPAPCAGPSTCSGLRVATPDAALQLLSLFQREARLIDFTRKTCPPTPTPTSAPPRAWCTKAAPRC
jgi:hypothetical protein